METCMDNFVLMNDMHKRLNTCKHVLSYLQGFGHSLLFGLLVLFFQKGALNPLLLYQGLDRRNPPYRLLRRDLSQSYHQAGSVLKMHNLVNHHARGLLHAINICIYTLLLFYYLFYLSNMWHLRLLKGATDLRGRVILAWGSVILFVVSRLVCICDVWHNCRVWVWVDSGT